VLNNLTFPSKALTSIHCACCPQHFRNVPISILGRFRSRGLDGVRSDRDQELHEVLGPTAVRIVFGHQHNRFAKHAHRYDVQFVSDNFRESSDRAVTPPRSPRVVLTGVCIYRRNDPTWNGSSRGARCGYRTSRTETPFPRRSTCSRR